MPAPQAGLMASLAQGIVGGQMAWPLIVVGVVMGFVLIMVQVRSPMLFAVGMYLPLETTFAIFLGGVTRWVTDLIRDRRRLNDAQKARVENSGVLAASGLIAGEALMGLGVASWHFFRRGFPSLPGTRPYFISLVVLAIVIAALIKIPLANAGQPDEPAPPTAVM